MIEDKPIDAYRHAHPPQPERLATSKFNIVSVCCELFDFDIYFYCAVVDCGKPGPFYNGYIDGQQTTFGSSVVFRYINSCIINNLYIIFISMHIHGCLAFSNVQFIDTENNLVQR